MSVEGLGCEPLVVLYPQVGEGSEEGTWSGQSTSSSALHAGSQCSTAFPLPLHLILCTDVAALGYWEEGLTQTLQFSNSPGPHPQAGCPVLHCLREAGERPLQTQPAQCAATSARGLPLRMEGPCLGVQRSAVTT